MSKEETIQIARELNQEINQQLAKTVETKIVDRKAFRDLFAKYNWQGMHPSFYSDDISDGKWLAILESVHEDIGIWASEWFAKGIDATKRGDLVRINLDDLDDED